MKKNIISILKLTTLLITIWMSLSFFSSWDDFEDGLVGKPYNEKAR